jgi:hypothetical protein
MNAPAVAKEPFFRCRACENTAAPEAVVEINGAPHWKMPRGWSWKAGAGPLCPNHNGHGDGAPKPKPAPVDVPAKVIPIETMRAGPIDYGDTSCINCGSVRFVRSGSCLLCIDCGQSNGCS